MGASMMTRKGLARVALAALIAVLAGCAGPASLSDTASGPGVPRIAGLRFEPSTVAIGEPTTMSFHFEVGSADLDEGFMYERGIADFSLFTSLQSVPLDLKRYSGQVAGRVEIPIRWSSEGIRFIEVQVVSKKGNTSNRLNATVTVR
jgi:hypothetical protein